MRRRTGILVAALAWVGAAVAGPAVWAAEETPSDEAASGEQASPGAAPTTAGPPSAERPWGQRRALVVVQRLPYERAGRWALTPYLGVIANDPFLVYTPVGLRAAHHLNESLALQLSVSWLDGLSLDRDLRRRVGDGAGTQVEVTLEDQQVARTQLDASWTVLAAKGRLPGGDLLYTRGHLLGGFGAVAVRDAAGDLTPRPEALLGLGFETHLGDTISLRAEVRQMIFARTDGGALLPTEVSMGLVWYPGAALEGDQ